MIRTAVAQRRFNCSDYLMFPEDAHYEIADGEFRPVPVPGIRHQSVALKIAAGLLRYVEARRLGRVLQAPCDVVFSREIVLRPDILFVEWSRRGIIGETNLRGTPDLVIEVLSKATRERDLRLKRRTYARFEVPEFWAVDSDAGIVETLVWSELGYVLVGSYSKSDRVSSPLLPKLNLPLSRIFGLEDE